jgi:hypothetical protein
MSTWHHNPEHHYAKFEWWIEECVQTGLRYGIADLLKCNPYYASRLYSNSKNNHTAMLLIRTMVNVSKISIVKDFIVTINTKEDINGTDTAA